MEEIEKKQKKMAGLWPVFVIIFLLVMIVVFLLIKMAGDTTTSGGFPGNESTKSLTCESNKYTYSFFTYDHSTRKESTFTATFKNDRLSNISFMYLLYYQTDEQVTESEAVNHAAMNISFSNSGLGADMFNATYAKMVTNDKVMKMSLFANVTDINDVTSKYWLLESIKNKDYSLNDIQSVYRKAGFDCRVNN